MIGVQRIAVGHPTPRTRVRGERSDGAVGQILSCVILHFLKSLTISGNVI